MSAFNPEAFEQTVVEGENQTAYIPVPEGDYEAYIEDYEFKSVVVNGEERVTCNISWVIPDEELANSLNMQELKVRQTLWLDLTGDGGIDFGTNKNVQLGRLRQALGLNEPGKPFKWSDLRSAQATISVNTRQDKNDASKVYNDVTKLAPAD